MWKTLMYLGCFVGTIMATPVGMKNMQIMDEDEQMQSNEKTEMALSTLNLPSNATSIRADITDGFTCKDRSYGYYADVENDCQIFHVCLPVVYADGKENMFRWSFICPEETVFSQESFTCMRSEDMISGCDESAQYYELNRNFGMVESSMEMNSNEMDTASNNHMMMPAQATDKNEAAAVDADMMPAMMKKVDVDAEDESHFQSQNLAATAPPVKVEEIKNKRKNANRRPVATKQRIKPIRKSTPAPTTTTTTTTTTTAKPIILNEPASQITEKPIEKTTIKYHQRFTRRPDIIKDNKQKKTEIPLKVEVPAPKRKRPQVSLNSLNTKTLINAPVKVDTVEQQTITESPTSTVPKESVQTEKPIILKNEEVLQTAIISEPKKEEEPVTEIVVVTESTESLPKIDVTKIPEPVISEYDQNEKIIDITPPPSPPSTMSENENQEVIDASNNRIPAIMVPQFIKVDQESMPHEYDQNQPQDHDQQSMIINIISSLVNAEHSKVEEEKFDNAANVQNPQIYEEAQTIITPDVSAQQLPPVPAITTTVPLIVQVNDEEILNSEHVADQENIKLKTANTETVQNFNNVENYQSHPYDQMTHIPVRILSLMAEQQHQNTMPTGLSESESESDLPTTVQETELKKDYITEQMQSTEKNTMEIIGESTQPSIVEAISMPEQQSTEILPNNDVEKLESELIAENLQALKILNDDISAAFSQVSAEVEPIFHRTVEPSNLLKPELLSVSIEEQPIVNEIDDNKNSEVIIQQTAQENQIDQSKPTEIVMPILEKITEILEESLNEKPTEVTILPTPADEIKPPIQFDEILVPAKEISIPATEPIPAEPIRWNVARSLKTKMDPRKRRFLFRSDAS